MTSTQNEFKLKLEKALESDNLRQCELKFSKDNPLLDGFLADVYFAEVSGVDKENTRRTLKVFVKNGKKADSMRGEIDVVSFYERESFFYTTLYPAFQAFVEDKNLHFDNVPHCLASVVIDNRRTIILEDLRDQGYKMNDVHKPMSLDQMKAVLKAYALFHGISIAFRDQKPEEFKKLTDNLTFLDTEKPLLQEHFREKYEEHNNKLFEMLQGMGEDRILKRWKTLLQRGSFDILRETTNYKVEEEESVVAHMDCWNNNIIFKYETEDDDDRVPSYVKLLDFQLTEMTSPVIDISLFFYINGNSVTTAHFDELLEHYYQHFSSFIKQMGSDPDKLFPFNLLKQHWKKYSLRAALRCWQMIHCILCSKEDLKSFEEMENISDFIFKSDYRIKDMDSYKERILATVKHYLEYQDKYSVIQV